MADSAFTEPESAANTDYQPIYPYNNIQQTEAGHSFEMDDTPTRERIRLQHRVGTFIEMHPNGDEVHKVYGDGYEITILNKNVLIKGNCNITIEGDSTLHVKGDSHTVVDGSVFQKVKGDVQQLINGNCEQTIDGDYDLNISGDFTVNADNVNINSDLNVMGDIATNQTVAAVGNITAGLSVSAKKSVETTGYMAAAISVTSPIINDIIGTLGSVRIGINSHVHLGVQNGAGVTPPPSVPII
jgi:hypothetical protein